MEDIKIVDYMLYMAYLDKKLSGFFEKQSPYIFCKRGCSKCCENGIYPFSKSEFAFLMIGYSKLPQSVQQKIIEKINKIKLEKQRSENKSEFCYECPFLINNECSVYNFRGIICRSFGLLTINPGKGLSKIPFCAFEGLNYSNVVEPDTKIISMEKYKKLGEVNEPLAYNVSYEFLTNPDIEKNFNIKFGEKRALIDWF